MWGVQHVILPLAGVQTGCPSSFHHLHILNPSSTLSIAPRRHHLIPLSMQFIIISGQRSQRLWSFSRSLIGTYFSYFFRMLPLQLFRFALQTPVFVCALRLSCLLFVILRFNLEKTHIFGFPTVSNPSRRERMCKILKLMTNVFLILMVCSKAIYQQFS